MLSLMPQRVIIQRTTSDVFFYVECHYDLPALEEMKAVSITIQETEHKCFEATIIETLNYTLKWETMYVYNSCRCQTTRVVLMEISTAKNTEIYPLRRDFSHRSNNFLGKVF